MDFSRPDNARKINKLKVLSELRNGSLSRAELSRRLGINKVSIGEMAKTLVEEGLATEGMKEKGTSGRPGTLLSLSSDAGRVIVLEEGSIATSVSALDVLGKMLRFERYPTRDAKDKLPETIERVTRGSSKILGSAVVSKSDIDETLLPKPIIYISRAIAEAEAEIRSSSALSSCLFLSWAEDFDGAFYKNELIHLPEIGHIKASKTGNCSCGRQGCLEAAASGKALMERTGAPSVKDLARNPSYSAAIREALRPMAVALSQAIQALSASSVMITGELSQLPDEQYAYLQDLVSSLLPSTRIVPIYRSIKGEKGTREGAAAVALDMLFYKTPLLEKLKAIESVDASL